MCIAIFSPRGNSVPEEKYLKSSFESNPDGAGFAFNTDDGRVQIVKGLMTYESFISTFNEYKKRFGFKKRGVLIHFRIQTHGGKVPCCTHPFPLSDDPATLKKTDVVNDYAIIHNGIITLTSSKTYGLENMSDTMVFIQKYLVKLSTNFNWFYNDVNFELIHDMIDSKMAILNGKGEIRSTTGFTKDEDGNFYSNNTYKEARPPKTYTYPSYYSGTYDKSSGGYQCTLYKIPNLGVSAKVRHYGENFIYNLSSPINSKFSFFVNGYGDLYYVSNANMPNEGTKIDKTVVYAGQIEDLNLMINGASKTIHKPRFTAKDFKEEYIYSTPYHNITYNIKPSSMKEVNAKESEEKSDNKSEVERVMRAVKADACNAVSKDQLSIASSLMEIK